MAKYELIRWSATAAAAVEGAGVHVDGVDT